MNHSLTAWWTQNVSLFRSFLCFFRSYSEPFCTWIYNRIFRSNSFSVNSWLNVYRILTEYICTLPETTASTCNCTYSINLVCVQYFELTGNQICIKFEFRVVLSNNGNIEQSPISGERCGIKSINCNTQSWVNDINLFQGQFKKKYSVQGSNNDLHKLSKKAKKLRWTTYV